MPHRVTYAFLLALGTLIAAACGGESTAPTNPAPVVTGITPDIVSWMSPATEVTVLGSGFVAGSLVLVEGIARPTTLVSSTELRTTMPETDFLTPRVLTIGVYTPSPGGGRSLTKELAVRLPPPALTGLSVTTTVTRTSDLVVRLTGTGFTQESVAYVSQAPRATTWIDWRTLDVVVQAADLASPRVLAIQVMNPGPNGGPTAPLELHVVEDVPVIAELTSSGATAGGGGFALSVHGSAFAPTSTVLWNGAPRPTEFVSRGRLVAQVSAADVASAGTAQVTVTTPAPGGGTSNAKSMTIRATGSATATSLLSIPLRVRDIAGDAARSLVYVSMPAVSPVDANSILALDPATGTIAKRVVVGADPGRLAMSGDGQYLYAGLHEAVRRVLLGSFTASLQWSLPLAHGVAELYVLPGRPDDVVVSHGGNNSSGVFVYENGVRRGQSSVGAGRLAMLASPDTAYSYEGASTAFAFKVIALNPGGSSFVPPIATGGLISGHGTHITGAGGRIYATDGSVVDAGRRVKVGSFALPGPAVAIGVDVDLGRAFLLTQAGIVVYDVNTFALLGTVAVPGLDEWLLHAQNGRVVRWGSDGLAFATLDAVYVVRSALFGA